MHAADNRVLIAATLPNLVWITDVMNIGDLDYRIIYNGLSGWRNNSKGDYIFRKHQKIADVNTDNRKILVQIADTNSNLLWIFERAYPCIPRV